MHVWLLCNVFCSLDLIVYIVIIIEVLICWLIPCMQLMFN